MNVQDITGGSTWAIAAAAFSNPMYLNSPLGKTDNSVSTGFQITPGAAVVVGFEGTYAGQTVTHEQTMDATGDSGWFSVEGSPSNGATPTSAGSTSGVAYVFTCVGVLHRIKLTALVSGTISVRIRLEGEAISTSGGSGSGGGGVSQGAVTTAAPTYVDGTDGDLSLDLKGGLRTLVQDAAGAAVDWTAPVATFGTGTAGSPGSGTGTSTTGVSSVQGPTAADAALVAAPTTVGARAANALPTAVSANGDVVNLMADLYGQLIARGALRQNLGKQYTALTNTSVTAIVTANATNKLDLYGLIIANTTSAAVDVLIEDGSADLTTITVPADDTRGFMLSVDSAIPQAAVNTAWNATGANGVNITALFVVSGA